jgi:hypothetical protein
MKRPKLKTVLITSAALFLVAFAALYAWLDWTMTYGSAPSVATIHEILARYDAEPSEAKRADILVPLLGGFCKTNTPESDVRTDHGMMLVQRRFDETGDPAILHAFQRTWKDIQNHHGYAVSGFYQRNIHSSAFGDWYTNSPPDVRRGCQIVIAIPGAQESVWAKIQALEDSTPNPIPVIRN